MKCKKFDKCSAPLCPLLVSKRFNTFAVWYPDEAICINPEIRKNIIWIKKQQKIKNRLTKDSGAFTIRMLNRINRVSKKTAGLMDIGNLLEYRTWLKKHHNQANGPEAKKARKRMIEHMKWVRQNYLFDAKNRGLIRGFLGQWVDPVLSKG